MKFVKIPPGMRTWFLPSLLWFAILTSSHLSATGERHSSDVERPLPVSVAVIAVPSPFDAFMTQTGNVKVTFSDGHSELWTEQGNCLSPRVSSAGLVGWIQIDKGHVDVAAKNRRGKDALIVRLLDGSSKKFLTNPEAPFIGNWDFSANETAVSIQSSGYHGPQYYAEYDAETGEVKDEIVRYVPEDRLPPWARQISNRESNGSLLLASVSATHSLAATDNELSIDQTLAQAQFNTVQMPPEQALVSKYGTGDTFVRNGGSYHVYYLPNLRLWLRCKGDVDDKLYKPISEIMISRIDLATRARPIAPLSDLNLKGIRIGDNIQRALSQWGEPLRKYPKSLGKKRTTVFEFFPDSLVEGSCLRFFVRDEIIVAFSFSSEE